MTYSSSGDVEGFFHIFFYILQIFYNDYEQIL